MHSYVPLVFTQVDNFVQMLSRSETDSHSLMSVKIKLGTYTVKKKGLFWSSQLLSKLLQIIGKGIQNMYLHTNLTTHLENGH